MEAYSPRRIRVRTSRKTLRVRWAGINANDYSSVSVTRGHSAWSREHKPKQTVKEYDGEGSGVTNAGHNSAACRDELMLRDSGPTEMVAFRLTELQFIPWLFILGKDCLVFFIVRICPANRSLKLKLMDGGAPVSSTSMCAHEIIAVIVAAVT